jgi:hypothetical protein
VLHYITLKKLVKDEQPSLLVTVVFADGDATALRLKCLEIQTSSKIFCGYGANHRHLRNIDCLTARTTCLVMNVSFVSCRSRKKKKRRLFCAALVAGTVNKLEQSILHLRYLWSEPRDHFVYFQTLCSLTTV